MLANLTKGLPIPLHKGAERDLKRSARSSRMRGPMPAEFEESRTIAKEHPVAQGEKVDALLEFTDRHIRGSNRRLMKLCQKRPNFCIDAVSRRSPISVDGQSTKQASIGARS